MKILINATALDARGAYAVASAFAAEMFEKTELLKKLDIDLKILCAREELKRYENQFIKIEFEPYPKKSLFHKWKYEKYHLPEIISREKYDAYLSLQNYALDDIKNLRQYVMIHQPIPFSDLKYSELELKLRLKYKILLDNKLKKQRNISGIFVQTNWMKEAVMKRYNFNCPILVVRPRANLLTTFNIPEASLISKITDERIKLFYPTSNEKYKNNDRLIESVQKYNDENDKKVVLLITIEGESSDDIKFLGKVSYERIGYFYENSKALIFPSLTETLGLPLLEARQFNLPVIVSNLPFAREICKEDAIYFNPREIDSISSAIMKFTKTEHLEKDSYVNDCVKPSSYFDYIEFIWNDNR